MCGSGQPNTCSINHRRNKRLRCRCAGLTHQHNRRTCSSCSTPVPVPSVFCLLLALPVSAQVTVLGAHTPLLVCCWL